MLARSGHETSLPGDSEGSARSPEQKSQPPTRRKACEARPAEQAPEPPAHAQAYPHPQCLPPGQSAATAPTVCTDKRRSSVGKLDCCAEADLRKNSLRAA